MKTLEKNKTEALKKFLGVTEKEAIELIDSGDYEVMTDEEADERAKQYIEGSLWAFNANFIFNFCNIEDRDGSAIKAFTEMQGKMCENANPIVKAMINEDIDGFAEEAIRADGRGHFMSSYDGEENEILINKIHFYIYRIN